MAKTLTADRYAEPIPGQFDEPFRAWLERRAYLDNAGNYRVRPQAATPTHRPHGPVAPWSRAVRKAFADSSVFHQAAHAWQDRRGGSTS